MAEKPEKVTKVESSSSREENVIYGSLASPPVAEQKDFRDEWLIEKDDLEIGPKIGKGSFGTVFSGHYGGSRVAIKQCSLSLDEDAIQDFKREAVFMLGLKRHPSIVGVLGVCSNDDQLYVVLEFCDRGSLDRQMKGMALAQKLSILDDVAKGVAHLHRCRVVHRDLACRNILLNETKEGFQGKVADFGMSRMIDKFEQQGQTNAAVGPVKYMAPESLANKTYSPASDAWTFGILCYELLAEEAPHANVDLFSAGLRIRDEGLTPKLPETTPSWLRDLCLKCWSKNPADRPAMETIVKEFKKHVMQRSTSLREAGSTVNSIQTGSSQTPVSSAQPLVPLTPPVAFDASSKSKQASSSDQGSESSSESEAESESESESSDSESGSSEPESSDSSGSDE